MIEIQDLRIGNLVNASIFGGKPGEQEWIHLTGKVDALHKDYINLGDGIRFEYRHISGIPLSEEILLKCGIKFKDGFYNITDEIRIDSDNFNVYAEQDNNIMVWVGVECKHLHQLQNLYFALTGQELNASGLI